MSKTNRNLFVTVAVLFLLSALTYRQSVGRADRFQRGQMFLSNLNPDEVATIKVTKGEDGVTLRRQGERFTIVEKQDYPASNSSVNRLLRDVLDIGLERQVGRGDGLAEELEIEPPGDDTLELALISGADKEMVRVRIGKTFEDGPGNYVQRLDEEGAPIYLTSSGVHLTSDVDSFLEKQILDHDRTEVDRIDGADFVVIRAPEGGKLTLEEVPSDRQVDSSAVDKLGSVLNSLRFDNVFVADDPEVADLQFDQTLEFRLADGSGYVLSLTNRDDRNFLKIRGTSQVQQVAITVDESEEELEEKAAMLTRADEIDAFNGFHGSWVYEISDWNAEKLELRLADLLESKES